MQRLGKLVREVGELKSGVISMSQTSRSSGLENDQCPVLEVTPQTGHQRPGTKKASESHLFPSPLSSFLSKKSSGSSWPTLESARGLEAVGYSIAGTEQALSPSSRPLAIQTRHPLVCHLSLKTLSGVTLTKLPVCPVTDMCTLTMPPSWT